MIEIIDFINSEFRKDEWSHELKLKLIQGLIVRVYSPLPKELNTAEAFIRLPAGIHTSGPK
jgi:hypothetical protein